MKPVRKLENTKGSGWKSVAIPAAIYIVTFVAGTAVFLQSPHRSVSHHYEDAANRWLHGEPLYSDSMETGNGFLYLPQAAVLHIPYRVIRDITGIEIAGDVVWRLTSWLLLALAAIRCGRWVEAPAHQTQWRMAMVVCLLGVSSLRIGQSTMLMTAGIVLAIDCWRRQRFSRSATWIAIAIAVKPLAIVPAMLLFAVSAPMRWRIVMGAGLVAVSVFGFQNPEYVWQQYLDCATMLGRAADLGNQPGWWAQLFGMLDVFGFPTPPSVQTILRLIAAIGTLALVYVGTRRFDRCGQAVWMLTWTAIYLMLFNPRTENSTYCLLGPVLGIFIAEAAIRDRNKAMAIVISTLSVLIAGSYEIGKHFTPEGARVIWLAPLACTAFFFVAYSRFWKKVSAERTLRIASRSASQTTSPGKGTFA